MKTGRPTILIYTRVFWTLDLVSSKTEWLFIPHGNHTCSINTSYLLGHREWIRRRTHQPVASHGILWEPLGKRMSLSAVVIISSFSSPSLHREERALLTVIPTSEKTSGRQKLSLGDFFFSVPGSSLAWSYSALELFSKPKHSLHLPLFTFLSKPFRLDFHHLKLEQSWLIK